MRAFKIDPTGPKFYYWLKNMDMYVYILTRNDGVVNECGSDVYMLRQHRNVLCEEM